MKNCASLLLLIVLLSGFPVGTNAGQEENLPGDMAMIGSWHGDEVVVKDNETWLALVEGERGYVLQDMVVSVEIVEDEIIDVPPAKTGKRVTVPNGVEAMVLLRNLPQLKTGPVVTAEIIDQAFNSSKPTGIYFNGMVFELEIKCDENSHGEEVADCPMLLSDGSDRQQLSSYPIYKPGTSQQGIASEAFPQVFWAGDLDRDGRLDLLLDLADHYNVSAPTLLLSSLAKDGEMVGFAAVFRTTGC